MRAAADIGFVLVNAGFPFIMAFALAVPHRPSGGEANAISGGLEAVEFIVAAVRAAVGEVDADAVRFDIVVLDNRPGAAAGDVDAVPAGIFDIAFLDGWIRGVDADGVLGVLHRAILQIAAGGRGGLEADAVPGSFGGGFESGIVGF